MHPDEPSWGPSNPHPLSRLKTELVWEGKYDEHGRRRISPLPAPPLRLEPCECIHPPRPHQAPDLGEPNLLVWADNRLAMAALLERYRHQIDLIYVDPPFDVGTTFELHLPVGDEGTLDAVAYRDRWGTGTDSYLHMLYERLLLMKELLSKRGNLFVHVDYRANAPVHLLLDEVFGPQLVNEVIWHYNSGPRAQNAFGKRHDTLFRYAHDAAAAFMADGSTLAREPYSPDINVPASKAHYYHPLGKVKDDVWRINILGQNDKRERTGLATQKPEALLEQIVAVCCPENGLVADFYCGSGTTLAVAEKLGRRWIGVDVGRHAIHLCRKRLIGVQRALHAAGRPAQPFDICSLGPAERRWWHTSRLAGSDPHYRFAVLHAYHPAPLPAAAFFHVAPVDARLSAADLLAAARAAAAAGARELHCLAWDVDPALPGSTHSIESETGVTIHLRLIPREIMDPNHGPCQFLEPGSVRARVRHDGGRIDVELLDVVPALPAGADPTTAALRDRARRSPLDFVDYWAVDFDHHPGQPITPRWQSFRTRRDRRLETRTTLGWTYPTPGPHTVLVHLIDVFAVATTTLLTLP